MPKQNYITRYLLIIKRLKKSPATFNELSSYLERESIIRDANFCISLRTFQREIKEIGKLNYEIKYNKSQKVYFIEESENSLEQTSRILESFEMLDILQTTSNQSEYVQFEKRKARGLTHFHGLLHAIKNRRIITLTYQKFYDEQPVIRNLYSLSLKESRGRWYLIAFDPYDNFIKTYGLDRIEDFEIMKQTFSKEILKKNINFDYCFGIMEGQEKMPSIIRISFTHNQAEYIKTLPLHESQKVIVENESELIIELKLFITYDLIMELLSYGDSLTVLSPVRLKNDIKNMLASALKNYAK